MPSAIRQARVSPADLTREQARRQVIADYFQRTPAWIEGNPSIRTPQHLAYAAFRQHAGWSVNIAKMVELPTGCGKTGVIGMAPFGIAAGRVLIITPNVTIREEIIAKLDTTNPNNIYQTLQLLPPGHPFPQVVELARGNTPNLDDCQRADIVVANIQQALLYTTIFPPGFFDLLIVDEGHHIPADSWQQILAAFPATKKLYLTATPFRADGQPLEGDPIYRYRLAEAIANGYVKNLIRVDAIPSRLVFVTAGTRTEYSQSDVLRLKEQDWFSRGIALSDACNETILEKAVQLLNAKRRQSHVPHQIIAAACSTAHAHRLVALCQRRGLRTTCLLSQMPIREQEAIKRAIKDNHYDCVVHVGMLGEGYDHPPFSIAAIFRPYRSRGPYEQFIGRTLRRIPDGTDADNLAHIVSHIGLNLDRLWNAFRDELRDPASYHDPAAPPTDEATRQTVFTNKNDLAEDDADGEERTIPIPKASREEIAEFAIDSFVPLTTPSQDPASPMPPPQAFAPAPARQPVAPQHATAPRAPLQPPSLNRPDRLRRDIKNHLAQTCRKIAGQLLQNLHLKPTDNLIPLMGKGDEKTNFEVLIRLVNRELNQAMGKDPSHSQRDSWTLDELTEAQRSLPGLVPHLMKICRESMDNTHRGSV